MLLNDSFVTEAMEGFADAILHHYVFNKVTRDSSNESATVGTLNSRENLNRLIGGHDSVGLCGGVPLVLILQHGVGHP